MTLKKGDKVIIHNSKLHSDLFVEGEATLIKKHKLQPDPDRQLWKVHFTADGPNEYYDRFVEEKYKIGDEK